MAKVSNEVRTGIIVASGLAVLWWGINFLKGDDFFSHKKRLYAIYQDVGGLAPSNPVVVNGMKVGSVKSIELMQDNAQSILVTINVSKDVRIPKHSIAHIGTPDLLSSRTVTILKSSSAEMAVDGDTLIAEIEGGFKEQVNSQVGPIKDKAESLLSSFDSVLTVVRSVFDENTKNNLKRSFESITNSLNSLEHVTASLDTELSSKGSLQAILKNLSSITSTIQKNNDKINKIIDNFASISDTLAKARLSETLANTQKTLQQTAEIFSKINKGQGTMGQLANNDSLYRNLNNTAYDLDVLLKDFKEHPKRYVHVSVFGGGDKSDKKSKEKK